jgi:hypothetical protein
MNRFFLLFPLIAMSLCSFSSASSPVCKESQNNTSKDTSAVSPYQKIFKGKSVKTLQGGAVKLHLVDGEVYAEFPDSLLGKRMIFGARIINVSDQKEATEGAAPNGSMSVIFTRTDSLLQLRRVSNNYFSSDLSTQKALELSREPAVYFSFPIICKSIDSTASVCKISNLFIGDRDYLLPRDNGAFNNMMGYATRSYAYKEKMSFIKDIISGKDYFGAISDLSYTVTRQLFAIKQIGEPKSFTSSVKIIFFLQNDNDYKPLLANSRVGVSSVRILDLTSSLQGVKVKFYATRWSVNSKAKPIITFSLSENFPDSLANSVFRAAAEWNKIFAKSGYAEAIHIVKNIKSTDYSGNFANISYSVSPSEQIRSSVFCDDKTGRILGADIIAGSDIVKSVQKDYLIGLGHALKDVRHIKIPEALVNDLLCEQFMHHIGKCLGFAENNRASFFIPTDSLASPHYTSVNGISASVMDDVDLNYIADSVAVIRGTRLVQDKTGLLDELLVKYVYGDGCTDAEIEKFDYCETGKYQDLLDPTSLHFDFGNDPIKGTKKAFDNLSFVVKNLNTWLDAEDYDYSYRAQVYDAIVERYMRYAYNLLAWVGGVEQHIVLCENSFSYKITDVNLQKNAMSYLLALVKNSSFMDSKELLEHSALNVSASEYLSKDLFEALLSKTMALREIEPLAESSGVECYRREDALFAIYDALFNTNADNLNSTQKRLQSLYISSIIKEFDKRTDDRDDIYSVIRQAHSDIIRKAKSGKNKLYYQFLANQLYRKINNI